MWQVSGRSDITDFEEVVRLDKEYIANWNIGPVSFRCIMPLSYRVTFLCNVLVKLIIHQKVLYDIFL